MINSSCSAIMSGFSAQFVVLLMYSCFFALCEGTLKITAEAGEDVTLQCQEPTDASIIAIEWSRPDLKSKFYVFFHRENRPYKHYQHPSFRGRVELRDPEIKNGDASVILKNVSVNDTGTYECVVSTSSRGDTEPTQSIELKVTESGHAVPHTEEEGDKTRGILPIPLTVYLIVILICFISWKCRRFLKKNSKLLASDEVVEQRKLSPHHTV